MSSSSLLIGRTRFAADLTVGAPFLFHWNSLRGTIKGTLVMFDMVISVTEKRTHTKDGRIDGIITNITNWVKLD